jgi:hypothetical protein
MKAKSIAILASITFVGLVLAFVVNRDPLPGVPQGGELVFPQLMSVVNEITDMKIATHEQTITLRRSEDGWGVEEKGGYQADVEKVKGVLVGLAELRLQDPKTKNPDLYDRLGLLSKDQDGSTSVTISLMTDGNTPVAEVIVGTQKPSKSNPRLSEIYIRKPDDPQSWLAIGNLRVDRLPEEWLDKEITALPSKRVQTVRVIHPGGEVLHLSKEKPEDMDFQLESIPVGYKVASTFTLNNVVGTLAQMSFEDVRKESDVIFDPKGGVTAVVETFDGFRLQVQTAQEGETVFGKFSAEFDPVLAQKTGTSTQTGSSKDDAEKPAEKTEEEAGEKPESAPSEAKPDSIVQAESLLKTPEEVQQEVEAFNRRVQGWVYELPKYRVENFAKRKKDLITNQP